MRGFRPMYTLLSCNVLCGSFMDPVPTSRFIAQTQKIRKLRPDIVCLQEFNNSFVERIYRKELSDEYHFMVDRIDHKELGRRILLCASMVSISYILHPVIAFIFVITSINPYIHNFIIGTQKTGNAILLHKSHPPTSIKTKEFENQIGDSLNLMRKRGFVDIFFNDILIRNTHLNHGKDKVECRKDQIDECLNGVCHRTLLVGDFNTENIYPIQKFGFQDCTSHLGCTYRVSNPLTYRLKKDKNIDYIFSYNVNIINAKKMDLFSDHDALFLEFS